MVKRKVNLALVATFTITCLIPKLVSADTIGTSTNGSVVEKTIVNNQNVIITETDYNNILKTHPEGYIMNMSQEQYNYLRSLDYSSIKKETKYLETTTNYNLGTTTERELTESEYNNINENNVYTINGNSNAIETTYKKLVLTILNNSNMQNFSMTCNWKIAPAVRSFDVIGVRFHNYNLVGGSQTGMQTYKVNGSYKYVSYSAMGTNIKNLDNGFGISMNVVDDHVTELYMTIDGAATKTSSTSWGIYGSYQHAKENVSLATSKSYTIGGAGLGSVFVWPYNTSIKYDGMNGVGVIGA